MLFVTRFQCPENDWPMVATFTFGRVTIAACDWTPADATLIPPDEVAREKVAATAWAKAQGHQRCRTVEEADAYLARLGCDHLGFEAQE